MINLETALQDLTKVRATLTDYNEIYDLARFLRESQKNLNLSENEENPVLPDKPGVYYFEVKFNFLTPTALTEFGNQWGRIRSKNHDGNIPRYYSERAKHHFEDLAAGKPIPFYLGKRKSISDRIKNHIESPLDSTTYALKLRARPHLINDLEFTYSYQAFDIPPTSYYGVELIEAELRKILNPIIGKQ